MPGLYPLNLNANQRHEITFAHRANLDQLNQLASWTDEDFDLAYRSYYEWSDQMQDWVITWDSIKLPVTDERGSLEKRDEIFER